MKKILLTVLAAVFVNLIAAAIPREMNYQVMVLDPKTGNIRASVDVALSVQIRKGSADGTAVFTQNFATHTDKHGLCNLTLALPDNLDMSAGDYYFVTLLDNEVSGSVKMTSVPYALYAQKADTAKTAKTVDGAVTESYLVGTWMDHKSEDKYTFNSDGTGVYYYYTDNAYQNINITWSINNLGFVLVAESLSSGVHYRGGSTMKIDANKFFISGDGWADYYIRQ